MSSTNDEEYSYPLTFSDEDQRMYEKLDAAHRDLYDSISYGAFIIKKGWKAKPWGRGSTYLQQSAFMTGMIVSYARPFTRSIGWPKLPAAYLDAFDADEKALHDRVLTLRHQLYAHTDSVNYPVKPYASNLHSDIIHFQVLEMAYADIEKLAGMCRQIARQCLADQVEIKAKYLKQ